MNDTTLRSNERREANRHAQTKKPYTPPKLIQYGSLQEITGMGYAGSRPDGYSGRARPW